MVKFPDMHEFQEQAQREPVKEHRGFIQRLFDKQIQRANDKDLDRYTKQIELHNNTANICIKNFELQLEVNSLKEQRWILSYVLFLILVILLIRYLRTL